MKERDEQKPQPLLPEGQGLGSVLEFLRTLWAVDHGLRTLSKKMLSTLGITGPQRLVIRLVGRFPGIAAKDLAGIMNLHPSTLTGILSRLEQERFILRKTDPHDHRRALFTLTAKGKKIDEANSGTVERVVQDTLAQLPPEKVAVAQSVLDALSKSLGV